MNQKSEGGAKSAPVRTARLLVPVVGVLALLVGVYVLRLGCTPRIKIPDPTIAGLVPAQGLEPGGGVELFISVKGPAAAELGKAPFLELELDELTGKIWEMYLDEGLESASQPLGVGVDRNRLSQLMAHELAVITWRGADGVTTDRMLAARLGYSGRVGYNFMAGRLRKRADYSRIVTDGVPIHRVRFGDEIKRELAAAAMGPFLFIGDSSERLEAVAGIARGKSDPEGSVRAQARMKRYLEGWNTDEFIIWWYADMKKQGAALVFDIFPAGGVAVEGNEIVFKFRKPAPAPRREAEPARVPYGMIPETADLVAAIDDIGLFWDNFILQPMAELQEAKLAAGEGPDAEGDDDSGPMLVNLRGLCVPVDEAGDYDYPICTLDWETDINPVFGLAGVIAVDGIIALADDTPVPDLILIYPVKPGMERKAAEVAFRVMYRTIDTYDYEPRDPVTEEYLDFDADDVERGIRTAPMSVAFYPWKAGARLSPSYLVADGWLVIALRQETILKVGAVARGDEASLESRPEFAAWLDAGGRNADGAVYAHGARFMDSAAEYLELVTRFSSRELGRAIREIGVPAAERLGRFERITALYEIKDELLEGEIRLTMPAK